MKATQIVEAVLFASDAPLKAEEIARADESLDEDRVEEAIRELRNEYAETGRAFQIEEVAEGYQILTLPEFAPYLERFDTVPRPSRLSGPALETLAIIAYRQPIGRLEIEYIRGVSSAGVIRTLQDRNLIDVVGRAEGVGRPLLYGTTQRFLEHFGFRSLDALPTPEELPIVLRERTPLGIEGEEEGASETELERHGQVAMPLGARPQEGPGEQAVPEEQAAPGKQAAPEEGGEPVEVAAGVAEGASPAGEGAAGADDGATGGGPDDA